MTKVSKNAKSARALQCGQHGKRKAHKLKFGPPYWKFEESVQRGRVLTIVYILRVS